MRKFFSKLWLTYIVIFMGVLCLNLKAYADVGAWIVFDANTGFVLNEKESKQYWHPASLTKIMTAYITYKAIREERVSKNSLVTMSKRALQEHSSKVGLQVGSQITVETAMHLLLVRSANDVAVALAERIAGSNEEFVAQMNKIARDLGMYQTHFANVNGWPHQDQVTSARDMGVLSKAIWLEFPEYREHYENSGLRVSSQVYWSANKEFLTRVKGAKGIKTGYICDSGYNLVAVSQRGTDTLIAVILGASSDLERTIFADRLMDIGFRVLNNLPPNPKNLDSLSANNDSRVPPVSGYCNRNKPNYPWLYETFGTELRTYYNGYDQISKLFSNSQDSVKKHSSIVLPKRSGTNKTDWSKVFDLTVGNQINQAKIIDLKFEAQINNELQSIKPRLKPLQ